jgi:hypothetical protein
MDVAVRVGGTTVAVLVGMRVAVAAGAVGVGAEVCVGGGVREGNGLGGGRVGNGVKVGKSKSNSDVGVGPPSRVGNTPGLGTGVEGLCPESRRNVMEHRQQNTRRNKAGIRILATCPCWLYAFRNVERRD